MTRSNLSRKGLACRLQDVIMGSLGRNTEAVTEVKTWRYIVYLFDLSGWLIYTPQDHLPRYGTAPVLWALLHQLAIEKISQRFAYR